MDEVVLCEYCGKPVQEDYNFILDHTAGFYGEHAFKDKDPTIVREGVFCSRSCLTSWLQKPEADERSCRTCKYDTELYEQNFCTLRKDIVMEFAKEHLGFPDDFKILNNWFMGLEPCEFYEKAPGALPLLSCPGCEHRRCYYWDKDGTIVVCMEAVKTINAIVDRASTKTAPVDSLENIPDIETEEVLD